MNWRQAAARFSGAVADGCRTAFALIYWNARKQAYVGRGRTGRCPCQNPSDDSVAGRVRCNAMLMWHSPARFSRVCPLLVKTQYGWCCSVAAKDVRPFWGRAFAWYGGGLAALGLAALLATLALLRFGSGVNVAPWDIAWPGRWARIREAQADQLYARAMAAMSAGRSREAMLALSSARERAPRHLPSGLLLAQVTMYQGSSSFADGMFEELLREHPEARTSIAVTYHDTLLSMDRMERLAEFALEMAWTDQPRAAVWVQSLLTALRSGMDVEGFCTHHIEQLRRLAPHAQILIEAERAIAARVPGQAVLRLREPFNGALNPIFMREQVERLASLGAPQDAQVLLDYYGPLLGPAEHQLTQFALDSLNHDEWGARATLRRVLLLPLDARLVERLATRLAQYPHPERFREIHRALVDRPEIRDWRVAAPLWLAALRSGCVAEAAVWRERARAQGEGDVPDIRRIDRTSRNPAQPESIAYLCNVMTLPREMVLVLTPERAPAGPALRLLP